MRSPLNPRNAIWGRSMGRKYEYHGLSGASIYSIWVVMIQRCTNPNDKKWKDYGARGISVCDRWANSFAAFYEDMGDRPKGLQLDRIDNDKGYSKDNCRWATGHQQSINRRMKSTNKSGVTGVFFEPKKGLYVAHISINGKSKNIGRRKDFFEAVCLRKSAENRIYFPET